MNHITTLKHHFTEMDFTANILMAVKMLLVIPFGVLTSTLVLYMTHRMHISDYTAIGVTASLLGSTGILRIAAGRIADRYLSHRTLILLSASFMFAGCLLAANPQLIYWGISSIAIGSVLTIAVNCLLTNIFQDNDTRRENAFLRNYSCMNIGYIISFLISGYYELHHQYQTLFLVSAIFSCVSLLIILINWQLLSAQENNNGSTFIKQAAGLVMIFLMLIGLYYFIKTASFDKVYFQIINVIAAFLILAFTIKKHSENANNKLYSYFVFIVPVLIFSTIQYLNPMIITLFIERNIDRQYLGLIISPQWVQLISTAAIILGGPSLCFLLEKIRKSGVTISPARLFSCGLILLGLSLLVIATGIMLTKNNELVNFNWILVSSLIQGVAELFIAPIGFAMIANIAPKNSRGVMMGNWLLLLNIGAIFAGYISNIITNISLAFLFLGGFAIIFGFVMNNLISNNR